MEHHARKIHDTLFISNRIITYKAAAGILNVKVNEAKSILKQYVEENADDSLNVAYVVGGITFDNCHKLTVVPGKQYESVKLKFSQITIDHIYSIQRSPLIDWTPVFNVDDFLYNKKDPSKEVHVKQEKIEPNSPIKTEVSSPEKTAKVALSTNKKGAISNFFSQNQNKSTNKVETNGNGKQANKKSVKPNALTNFMSKNTVSNKENITKQMSNISIKKEEIKKEQKDEDSDDNEEVIKKVKKRSRIIIDDDDDSDNTPTKCAKVDILDDPMDCDDYRSDEDIFGSPEKQDEVEPKNDSKEVKEKQVVVEDNDDDLTEDLPENDTENSEQNEVMLYQDEEGFFVTEKKAATKCSKVEKKVPLKKETKEKIIAKKKIEKETKKEIKQKLKKNTNQNTLFTYFNKK